MKEAFHAQSFNKRFAVMGDVAEQVYEEVKPLGNTTRFGFRRPKGVKFSTFPVAFRHMPDFITASYLVEVMGLGRDGILKSLKLSKYEALKEWHKHSLKLGGLGVVFFIWNSAKRQYIILAWKDVVDEVKYSKRKYGVLAFENDGNEYYRLDWTRLVAKATFVGNHEQ
jgi:hypothetical protein